MSGGVDSPLLMSPPSCCWPEHKSIHNSQRQNGLLSLLDSATRRLNSALAALQWTDHSTRHGTHLFQFWFAVVTVWRKERVFCFFALAPAPGSAKECDTWTPNLALRLATCWQRYASRTYTMLYVEAIRFDSGEKVAYLCEGEGATATATGMSTREAHSRGSDGGSSPPIDTPLVIGTMSIPGLPANPSPTVYDIGSVLAQCHTAITSTYPSPAAEEGAWLSWPLLLYVCSLSNVLSDGSLVTRSSSTTPLQRVGEMAQAHG